MSRKVTVKSEKDAHRKMDNCFYFLLNLTSVSYQGMPFKTHHIGHLLSAVSRHPDIAALTLNSCSLAAYSGKAIAAHLPDLHSIVSFSLANNPICDSGLRALVAGLQSSCSRALVTLDLTNTGLTNKSVPSLNRLFTLCPALVSLDVGCNPLKESGAMALARRVPKAGAIRFLGLRKIGAGAHTAKKLVDLLGDVVSLTGLDLGGNNIESEGVKAVVGLMQKRQMRFLNLSGNNNMGSDSLILLLKRVENNASLQELGLNNCGIAQDVEVLAIVNAIIKSNSLTHVYLRRNGLSRESCAKVAEALKANYKMQKLDLRGQDCDHAEEKKDYPAMHDPRVLHNEDRKSH